MKALQIICGDVTIVQGLIAILVAAAAKYATAWLTYLSPGFRSIAFSRFVSGIPRIVLRDGHEDRDALRREQLSEKERCGRQVRGRHPEQTSDAAGHVGGSSDWTASGCGGDTSEQELRDVVEADRDVSSAICLA